LGRELGLELRVSGLLGTLAGLKGFEGGGESLQAMLFANDASLLAGLWLDHGILHCRSAALHVMHVSLEIVFAAAQAAAADRG
jgi:hypothetical protein